jgi:hypothetical protein
MTAARNYGVWKVAFVLLITLAPSATARAQIQPGSTGWNWSPDPNAQYGLCLSGSIGSALGLKMGHVYAVGETAENILAITVLNCTPFSGGGAHKVPCPSGSPYAFCTNTGNDGLGNNVTLTRVMG